MINGPKSYKIYYFEYTYNVPLLPTYYNYLLKLY